MFKLSPTNIYFFIIVGSLGFLISLLVAISFIKFSVLHRPGDLIFSISISELILSIQFIAIGIFLSN